MSVNFSENIITFKSKFPLLFSEYIPSMSLHFADYLLLYETNADENFIALITLIVYSTYTSHSCFTCSYNPLHIEVSFDENETAAVEADLLFKIAVEGALNAENNHYYSIASADSGKPVLYFNSHFYLSKYFSYEKKISKFIHDRVAFSLVSEYDSVLINQLLQGLSKEQRGVVLNSVDRKFAVISGGPGTGKTTVVLRLILLRILKAIERGEELSLLLVAPTGKAALRLQASIQNGISKLKLKAQLNSDIERAINLVPEKVYTVHNAVSLMTYSSRAVDLVILDEASMVDTALATRLINICSTETSLIMLGDEKQLASVQAGSVLSDIVSSKTAHNVTEHLTKSYRFDPKGGIGKAAYLINSGSRSIIEFLESNDPSLLFLESDKKQLDEHIVESLIFLTGSLKSYAAFTTTDDTNESLVHFLKTAFLCAVRRGPKGVETVNEIIESLLEKNSYIKPKANLYHNMPILITKNNYTHGVFNGDTGLVRKENDKLTLCVGVKKINPLIVESFEKSYALTIHKSQGSEYDGVVIILPDHSSPLLTKELLYTALTRARKKAVIISKREVLLETIKRETGRMSGLKELIDSL
jgi:exodeoxyribonuclease V alpha subunit